MYLLYLDASGTPDLQDHTQHYVLVGACVHEGTWFALDKRIRGLKKRYAFPGEDFELHVKDFKLKIDGQEETPDFASLSVIDRRAAVETFQTRKLSELRANGNATKAKRLEKEYKLSHSFAHLTRPERSKLYEDALDLIGNHRGIVLFAEAIDKKHPTVSSRNADPTRQAFEQVVTRFDAYLERRYRWRQLSKPSRNVRIETGLLVMDKDYEKEREIERQFQGYREHGHPWGRLRHVIDAPFFVASEKLPGIQIVDVCAYALRAYLDKKAKGSSVLHEEKQLNRIINLFDRDASRLHGLRHFTQLSTCHCMICHERGNAPPAPTASSP